MTEDHRIQQFRKMSEADPDNELAHFSLGKACLEVGQFEQATTSLRRTIELNPKLSKAHQLLAEAYDGNGQRDNAINVMTKGVTIADEQGDRLPRDAMADRLRAWGAPVPEFKTADTVREDINDTGESAPGFQCSRCSRPGGQLPKVPFKGLLGQQIHDRVCTSCWREWIPTGTKVINELGLSLASPAGQEAYDQYMIEFLQLEDR
jgi:Fe-S cluster biosynthesis and repair protein YggX